MRSLLFLNVITSPRPHPPLAFPVGSKKKKALKSTQSHLTILWFTLDFYRKKVKSRYTIFKTFKCNYSRINGYLIKNTLILFSFFRCSDYILRYAELLSTVRIILIDSTKRYCFPNTATSKRSSAYKQKISRL